MVAIPTGLSASRGPPVRETGGHRGGVLFVNEPFSPGHWRYPRAVGAAVRDGRDRPLPRREVHFALENDGWNCTFECEVHVSALGALAPAAGWLVAPLPEVCGGAGCPNLPQRPRSGRGAREESLIFRAFLRGRSRPGGPLWQIWTRPHPGPPQESHQHHHMSAHPSRRADSDPQTRTHRLPFPARKAQ